MGSGGVFPPVIPWQIKPSIDTDIIAPAATGYMNLANPARNRHDGGQRPCPERAIVADPKLSAPVPQRGPSLRASLFSYFVAIFVS